MIAVPSIEMYKSEKIVVLSDATKIIDKHKTQRKTVGLCHGGFDLTHPGHVKHFEMAKKLCDVLFVSVTSDKFVSERKGSGRPVYGDKLRAYMIACFQFVDYVVITDFKSGVDVIKALKPTHYIKGPDFVNKTTPGITAEREAIKSVGGEMKYTTEPPMSTTKIIEYIKNEVDNRNLLLIIDRDGTIIKNNDFFGRDKNWKQGIQYNKAVIDFISYLQTKYKTTKIVVSNQAGVARCFFDCKTVEEINSHVNSELVRRGVKIDDWQYCPDVDTKYAQAHPEMKFDLKRVKDTTKRKPGTNMVYDSLKKLNKEIKEFTEIIVIGDRDEDRELAEKLNTRFIDVNDKTYELLVKEFS